MLIGLKKKYRTGKTYKGVSSKNGGNGTKKHAAAPGLRAKTIKGASHSGTGGMKP